MSEIRTHLARKYPVVPETMMKLIFTQVTGVTYIDFKRRGRLSSLTFYKYLYILCLRKICGLKGLSMQVSTGLDMDVIFDLLYRCRGHLYKCYRSYDELFAQQYKEIRSICKAMAYKPTAAEKLKKCRDKKRAKGEPLNRPIKHRAAQKRYREKKKAAQMAAFEVNK